MFKRNVVGRMSCAVTLAALVGCGGSSGGGEPTDVRANEPPVVVSPPANPPADGKPAPNPPAGGSPASGTPQDGVVAGGSFVDKDERGSGTALLVRDTNGATSLRLEGLDITPGPTLHVLLTQQASPSTRADVEVGMLDLGALRANKGNLTYPLPAGTAVAAFAGVTIYCAEYHVVFAAAALTPR